MKRFAPWVFILLAPLLISMGKKEEFSITFHSQGSDTDMPKTIFPFVLDGRSLIFKILPEISQRNIAAYHSFPSPTGGNGLTLQLDFRGKQNLDLITRTRNGEYLLALVNGQPVDYVRIDQVVSNGMITIWQGVPDSVIAALAKKHPRITSSGAPSMTDKFEMSPTTPKEKKKFLERFKKEEREASRRKKAGVEEKPNIPSFNLPTASATDPADPAVPSAPTSSQMPIEGGVPPLPGESAAPGQPPLPQ
jgi:hypothetical protein